MTNINQLAYQHLTFLVNEKINSLMHLWQLYNTLGKKYNETHKKLYLFELDFKKVH